MGSKKRYSSSEELPSTKREKKHRKRRYSSSEEEQDDDDEEDDEDVSSSSSSEEDRSHRKRRSRDHSRRAHHKEKRRKKEDKREKRKEHRRKHGSSRKKSKERKYSDSENELPSPSEVVSTILRKFPEVAHDLEKLLEMIDDGQAVDISGLTNKRVAAYLRELFRSLRLHRTSNGLFLLPENAAKKTMDILQPTLKAHFCPLSNNMTTPSEPQEQVRDKDSMDSKQDDKLVERSDGKREINISEETCGPSEQKRRVIGPAMPSAETLAAAAKLTEASIALRAAEEELELDPLIGPPPPAAVVEAESANDAERFEEVERILAPDIENAYEILGLRVGATPEMLKKRYWKLSLLVHPDKCSHPHAHQAFTVLNQAFKDLQDPSKRSIIDNQIEEKETRREFEAELKSKREAAQWRKLRGEALPGDDALLDPPKAPTRDEWMTQLPPERRAGPPSMHSTFFSKSEKSGRGDTSIWTDTPLEKAQKAKTQYLEAYKQAALQGGNVESPMERDCNSQARELMDRFNSAKRSTSLLEKHELQRSKKPKDLRKEEPPEWVGNHPWKPWDREKDLTAGRQSVKLDKDNMAQGLSNRFSSSHTERSFL